MQNDCKGVPETTCSFSDSQGLLEVRKGRDTVYYSDKDKIIITKVESTQTNSGDTRYKLPFVLSQCSHTDGSILPAKSDNTHGVLAAREGHPSLLIFTGGDHIRAECLHD